ncbi:N-acetylmuramoyl-L-alanine amidase [Candidatus Dependentiae bacterium]|nr:N-acetylmuramoyl-L-alanine amidase [Candidatus Dependentiae bacterium]
MTIKILLIVLVLSAGSVQQLTAAITQWFLHQQEDVILLSCYAQEPIQPIVQRDDQQLTIILPATIVTAQQELLPATIDGVRRTFSAQATTITVHEKGLWYAVGSCVAVQQKQCCIIMVGKSKQPSRYFRHAVRIDAGHGGNDTGAVANTARESVIALQVSMQLAQQLQQLSLPYLQTRMQDKTILLDERTRGALHDAIVVSLHCNSSSNAAARGIEVLYPAWSQVQWHATTMPSAWRDYLQQLEDRSKQCATDIMQTVTKQMRALYPLQARSIVPACGQMLQGSLTVSVLVELGFLTNREECAALQRHPVQQQLAISVAAALAHCLL